MTVKTEQPMWMDNLEEWVMDENKVISAKFVSRALNVHINIAKERLFHFYQNNLDKGLEPIYFVSGKDEDGRILVKLVKGSEIENVKLQPMTSKHMYAIAKKEAKGHEHLLLSVMDTVRTYPHVNTFNAVVNKNAVPRRMVEPTEPTLEVKKEVVSPQKKETQPSATQSKAQTRPEKKKGAKGSNSIAGMFANAAATKKEKKPEKNDQKPDRKRKEPEADQEISPGKENRENEIREKANGKDTTQSKKSLSVQPKRKRIQMMSDSESSDDDNEEEKEDAARMDVVEEELEREVDSENDKKHESEDDTIPQTPEVKVPTNIGNRRKRGKKLVEKTFTDDQGFMVTKKEYESYSESDGEPEQVPIKSPSLKKNVELKPETKKVAKKIKPDLKNKQSSIMNFFKKK